ncbi:HpcH/HpaI aldolase/citrate lyase family protein [Gulosibacter molinativorax]|uniref:CoA ester lyase n=1 Tax=Gulosibacter molinativorax TaxID=256821 RepID=A0ABT7C807_9MICO|nr:CoA ester lyase [Gulosibacter molinativorax]MDJ1370889.1 CoA ester lyase [Gulosibacter molinativorax]QUY62226.1 Malyl-CoA lyase [Gulosibacter molinativorax]
MTTPSISTKHHVPAEISRSWLLLSAREEDRFDKARASRSDQLILDLEDGVDPSHKDSARASVLKWFSDGNDAWVRINVHGTSFWEDDIELLRGNEGLSGVMLAKVERPEEVTETFERLGGKTPVIPLIESALGIEAAVAIAQAKGVFRLAFGSGDYRRDTGTSATALAMAYPRSRLTVASAIAGLTGPIDGPTVSKSHPILREQSETAVSLGLTGKLCLDTNQLPVINETFSPPASDVGWARDFLNEFNERGRVVRDGSDLPRLHRAERIDGLARAFGIEPV